MSHPGPRALGLDPWPESDDQGLFVMHRSNGAHLGTVICVHGTLDRGGSFARIARRLEGAEVVAYDRRGYQGSRALGPARNLATHVEDLVEVISRVRGRDPVTVVGHSFGAVIALRAGIDSPAVIDNLVVYEPPLPWLSDEHHAHRGVPLGDDPDEEVERFFRRMVSSSAWERLSDEERASRLADGPALVSDLTIVRMETPFRLDEIAEMPRPLTVVHGSKSALAHHVAASTALSNTARASRIVTIEGAGHGAHLSQPDSLSAIIAAAIEQPPQEDQCAS